MYDKSCTGPNMVFLDHSTDKIIHCFVAITKFLGYFSAGLICTKEPKYIVLLHITWPLVF